VVTFALYALDLTASYEPPPPLQLRITAIPVSCSTDSVN